MRSGEEDSVARFFFFSFFCREKMIGVEKMNAKINIKHGKSISDRITQ